MRAEVYERYWKPGEAWSPSEHSFYPYERALMEEVGRLGDICLDYGCGDAKRYRRIGDRQTFKTGRVSGLQHRCRIQVSNCRFAPLSPEKPKLESADLTDYSD